MVDGRVKVGSLNGYGGGRKYLAGMVFALLVVLVAIFAIGLAVLPLMFGWTG